MFFTKAPGSIFSIAVLLSVVGCSQESPAPTVQIANPASVHCINKGGKLEVIKEESGDKSMCHLPDGTVVEEWELFRRDNPQNP